MHLKTSLFLSILICLGLILGVDGNTSRLLTSIRQDAGHAFPNRVVNLVGSSRRLILVIGDGMGLNHRLAGEWNTIGMGGTLAMDSLPVKGWIHTENADGSITDSAAAATAMATGWKTKNGYLGVDQIGSQLISILDVAMEMGMSTGLVVTSQITNATPAAFTSHINNRSLVLDIANQMLSHDVTVLLGGGEGDWIPDTTPDCLGTSWGKREDGRNLIKEAQLMGYEYICTPTAFATITPDVHKLIGFFGYEKMVHPYSPSLADMTERALDILSDDPEGFFLMVEGSQIDNAAHDNDGLGVIGDVKMLDDAVQVAVDFADVNSDTLLIITADHETGGLALYQASSCYFGDDGPFAIQDGGSFCMDFSTIGHTNALVPLTAMGPGSQRLSGEHSNIDIFHVMYRYLTMSFQMNLPILLKP